MTERLCQKCERPADGGRGLCEKHWAALRSRLRAYGKWDPDQIDPTEAQEHLAALKAWGMGSRRLQVLTGLSRPTLAHLPDAVWITRRTHDAILSVPIPQSVFDPILADGQQIDALGSRRRIRALAAIGWDSITLSEKVGDVGRHRITAIASGRQPKVTVARARRIAEVFERLQMTPGPSRKARRLAELKGWPKPLQWDEEELDNPKAQAHANRQRWVSSVERINELYELGITDMDAVAARLGVKREAVRRALAREEERQRRVQDDADEGGRWEAAS